MIENILPLRVGFSNSGVRAACMDHNPGWTAITSDKVGLGLGGVVALVANAEHADLIVCACNAYGVNARQARKQAILEEVHANCREAAFRRIHDWVKLNVCGYDEFLDLLNIATFQG
jgi:hypothetical protein